MDSSAQRLINLANQWENHRAPLIEQFRTLKELSAKSEVYWNMFVLGSFRNKCWGILGSIKLNIDR